MVYKTRLTVIVLLTAVLLTGCEFPQIQPSRYGVVTEETVGFYKTTEPLVGMLLTNGMLVRVFDRCREIMEPPVRYCLAELVDYPYESIIWLQEDKILFAHETGILTPEDDGYNIADFRVAMKSLPENKLDAFMQAFGLDIRSGEAWLAGGECVAINLPAEMVTVPESFYKVTIFTKLTVICAPDGNYTYYVNDGENMHREIYFPVPQ